MSDELQAKLRAIMSHTNNPVYDQPYGMGGDDEADNLIAQIDRAYKEAYRDWMTAWDNQTVCGQCSHRFTAPEDFQLHADKFHPTSLMTGQQWLKRFYEEMRPVRINDFDGSDLDEVDVEKVYEAAKRAAGISNTEDEQHD